MTALEAIIRSLAEKNFFDNEFVLDTLRRHKQNEWVKTYANEYKIFSTLVEFNVVCMMRKPMINNDKEIIGAITYFLYNEDLNYQNV